MITAAVNGHPVTYQQPAHKQDHATWQIQSIIAALHVRLPLQSISLARVTGRTFAATLTLADLRSWTVEWTFTDGEDALMSFSLPTWRRSEFSLTRDLRDALATWLATDVVDSATWTVS